MGVRSVDYFFVTNYDEDHISDLPFLRANLPIRSLVRNKSINDDQLRRLKREGGPITPAMEEMLGLIRTYTGGPLTPAPEFPDVSFRTFSNPYGTDFADTNNISLVTFLEAGDTKFIIPGDLEIAGWEALLTDTSFVRELAEVDVFIASHHGRESGYCEAVFDHCSPDVVIFSDDEIQYETQGMASTYGAHASGINFNGATRYVLSTRQDGSLTWGL
jgi:beta-lactamase superfamily II metal-dependent hydrolase